MGLRVLVASKGSPWIFRVVPLAEHSGFIEGFPSISFLVHSGFVSSGHESFTG